MISGPFSQQSSQEDLKSRSPSRHNDFQREHRAQEEYLSFGSSGGRRYR